MLGVGYLEKVPATHEWIHNCPYDPEGPMAERMTGLGRDY